MAKPGAATSRDSSDHVIQDLQCPCPNYTLPLNPCDRNCCQCAPSPLCAIPHRYSGAAQLLLPVSCEDVERLTCWRRPGPTHWCLQASGGPGVSPYPLDQPATHPDTHPAGEISLSGWMAGWGGYRGGGWPAHLSLDLPHQTHTNPSLPINKLTMN